MLTFNPETDPHDGLKWDQKTIQNFVFYEADWMADDDWMAAYRTMNGVVHSCAGSHFYGQTSFSLVPVMGEDGDFAEYNHLITDLFQQGDPISFICYDKSQDKAYNVSAVDWHTGEPVTPTFGVNNKFHLLRLVKGDEIPMSDWIWIMYYNQSRIANIQAWRELKYNEVNY